MEKNKSNSSLLIVVGVLILLVAAFLVLLCMNRNTEENSSNNGSNSSSNTNNGGSGSTTNEVLDLDKLSTLIKENNYYIALDKCDCTNIADETDFDDAECDSYEISSEDMLLIIDKLKSSSESKDLSTSTVCSKYNFAIFDELEDDPIIAGFVSQNLKSILIGYKEKGYAFDFDEDVSSVFESIISKY